MTSSAFSVKVFGIYLLLAGCALLFAPNAFLALLWVAEAKEVWIRVLGTVVMIVGYYYWACGNSDVRPFFTASVYGRFFFFLCSGALVAFANAPTILLLFGVTDLFGAAWTLAALRHEGHRLLAAEPK